VDDEQTRTLFEEAVNRVRTIGDIHELLYRSPELARVDFNLYLNRLAGSLCAFYAVDRNRIGVRVDAKDTKLELGKAIPCGLIVNELLTNALKYAFPEGRSGEIRVKLRCEGGECLLEVADNGVGVPEEITLGNTTSLGLKLVSVLAQQVRGEVRLERHEGTRFVISFPATGSEKQA
jgi:two-component sensor histidine kinase